MQNELLTEGSPSTPGAKIAGDSSHYHVLALRAFEPGETVLRIEGEQRDRPSRHTIQLGASLHVEAPPIGTTEDVEGHCVWRYLNHSCDANAAVQGREVVAVRPILTGEEVTFNYNTTEYDMASPFACHCGSPFCLGEIRGFIHLTQEERERLRPVLAPYLCLLLEGAHPKYRPIGEHGSRAANAGQAV